MINVGPRESCGLRPTRRALTLTFVASSLTLATACGSNEDSGSADVAPDVELAHVHGLGINPADQTLIVATHDGALRIAADGTKADPIGSNRQDTMGFTVVGPDHFLGSGHPDQAGLVAGQPTRLGLIESTDGGTSWTTLSLSGEGDFHALVAEHGYVYGWDSGTGRFMVSSDRNEWDVRSSVAIFSFAVDPSEPDHVIAAGPDGLLESNDGGQTWSVLDGPVLVTLSWDETTGLWGVGPDGVTHHRQPSGWVQAGTLPGQPQVLLAVSDAMYAAAVDSQARTGIYRSTDGGKTWDLHYRDNGS